MRLDRGNLGIGSSLSAYKQCASFRSMYRNVWHHFGAILEVKCLRLDRGNLGIGSAWGAVRDGQGRRVEKELEMEERTDGGFGLGRNGFDSGLFMKKLCASCDKSS